MAFLTAFKKQITQKLEQSSKAKTRFCDPIRSSTNESNAKIVPRIDISCQGWAVILNIKKMETGKMKKPKFEMTSGKDGKFSYQLKAANGHTVLTGRGFSSTSAVILAIAAVMRYGLYESRYVRKGTITGQHYFQLRTPSGRILGRSEMYHSYQGRENGINAVRMAVQYGRVLDLN